ncbi:MAG: PAS domain-containing protein [Candidatus Latescibacteria bacterium]|jgi:two-component system, OmpR family, phosphate regulon sensor histidine kinase PhoR|nr:PAS domain-containing protein [Candidatus Latescibacterota bacterium]
MRLHWKLMLTYVSVVVMVMASVHVYLDRSMHTFLVSHLTEALTRELRLARSVVTRFEIKNGASFDSLADELGQQLGVRVTLIDAQGHVLGDSAVPVDEIQNMHNHADRPEVQTAWQKGQGKRVRYSETLGTDMLYVAATLPGLLDGRMILRLAMPLRAVGEMKKPISRAIWMASAFGLVLALLLAYGSSRYVSRPIVDMTRVARDVASGIYTPRHPEGATSLELQDLASALDEMRRQIQGRIGQITLEKSRLEAVLASITEGILVTEQSGRVSIANRAFGSLFGVSQDPVGRMPIELVRQREVQDAIEQTMETGKVVFLDLMLSDGLERYLDVHVAPILQEDTCVGSVTVFYDITELRRLERIRKDFVANVSHELRTPLTTIKGCAATLADGALEDKEAAKRFVDMINNHADRLHDLVEDVLDLSRMESGTLVVESEMHSVQEMVNGAVDQVQIRSTEKNIDLQVSLDGQLYVCCDYKLIEQALVNLLDNAVKYTPEGGTVRVVANQFSKEDVGRFGLKIAPGLEDVKKASARGSGKRIAIEVQDTGVGVPLASISRIFERFYRVDQGRTRAIGGTGLGLSIVRHIMEAHGERVYVKSEEGRGTTFGLTLPVV